MGTEGCRVWYSILLTLTRNLINVLQGLPKAEYAVGYFTEMGIGCRRDPLESNLWYVRAAEQGDERAKHRIAAIRAAASGGPPPAPGEKLAAKEVPVKNLVKKKKSEDKLGGIEVPPEEKVKGKKWGIFK